MFDLFGSQMPVAAKFLIAFAVVLVLIGLTAWLVRRFGSARLGGSSRGRQPRLAVIDAAAIDGRRRLVLIRRDNIEHLLMIGGPTDVVVEPNIVRAVGARDVTREPQTRAATESASRPAPPAVDNGWPLQPTGEPVPMAPSRPYRTNATDEPWLPPEPGARARPAADLGGELPPRNNPAEPVVRAEPRIAASLAGEPVPAPQTDHNLAEMAQQLEAALRRPPIADNRMVASDPLATPLTGGKLGEPQRFPPREPKPRSEPKLDVKFEPKLEPGFDAKLESNPEARLDTKPEPLIEPKLEPKLEPAAPSPGKTLYDNLEQEMANLLGRPPGKS